MKNFKSGDRVYFIFNPNPSGIPMLAIMEGVVSSVEIFTRYKYNQFTRFLINDIKSDNIKNKIPTERLAIIKYREYVYNHQFAKEVTFNTYNIDFNLNGYKRRTTSPGQFMSEDLKYICNLIYYIRMILDIFQDDCNKFNKSNYEVAREECLYGFIEKAFI